MPRPNPPPTPGSSSDIRGKESAQPAPVFNLPPNAYQDTDRMSASSTPSANGSDSSYRPLSPATPADLSRKRTASQSGSVITKDDFALPPPPTRSRKIIQMKPRESEQDGKAAAPPAPTNAPAAAAKTSSTSQTGGRKGRNNSNTTAAGRKIARKTAHSLIERRRRSKMNEEFGVLKDMIPACQGQEMHKLAILQASIDYLRYLERCVSDLQAQNNSPRPQPAPASRRAQDENEEEEDDEDEDEEMEDEDPTTTTSLNHNREDESAVSTPATNPQDRSSNSVVSLPSLSQITTTSTTTSPSVFSTNGGRHYSISSAASQASYSPYFHSNQTSPAFGPQLSHQISAASSSGGILPAPFNTSSREVFGLGSPAIKPLDSSVGVQHLRQIAEGTASDKSSSEKSRKIQKTGRSEQELDQEATAALLMLNHDRRNWRPGQDGADGVEGRRGKGMSVKDLLSG